MLKRTDFIVPFSSNVLVTSYNTGLNGENITGISIAYNDEFYSNPCIPTVGAGGGIALRFLNPTTKSGSIYVAVVHK